MSSWTLCLLSELHGRKSSCLSITLIFAAFDTEGDQYLWRQSIISSLGWVLVQLMDLRSAMADMVCLREVLSCEKLLEDLVIALCVLMRPSSLGVILYQSGGRRYSSTLTSVSLFRLVIWHCVLQSFFWAFFLGWRVC